MAVRARLSAPRQVREDWHFHNVRSASLSASMLFGGDRRMEAESFLADGFATRMQIQSKHEGWSPLSEWAKTWQPNRLKGIQVSEDMGTPFLAATQVYDLRPTPRKWLSLEKTEYVSERFVKPGTILLTCSGTVGRATLARDTIVGSIISHDLLRVEPIREVHWGWIYAYLRAPSIIALMQAAHYGHVIKHLEVSHLDLVPVVEVEHDLLVRFNQRVSRILECRNRAEKLITSAEKMLTEAFELEDLKNKKTVSSSISVSDLACGRRRLEGAFHAASIKGLLQSLEKNASHVESLGDLVDRVWWMTRFSRNFGPSGVPYRSADELFSISQVSEKRVFLDPIPNYKDFFVKAGWLLMACSGQIYGLNGSVTLATNLDEDFFFSHDLIRISPVGDSVRPGYLFAYLGHPDLGQPLVKRFAYGSSIPHIDPSDVERIPIARMDDEFEKCVSDLAEEASSLNAEATDIEREISLEAEDIIQAFLR